jgi:outer membrane immunogenic protein
MGRLLFYGKGGYANGKISVSGANTDGDEFAGSKRHDGWVLGAGVEYLLATNVVVGLEYSHIDLEEETYSFNSGGATLRVEDVRSDVDAFSARVSYKFSGL